MLLAQYLIHPLSIILPHIKGASTLPLLSAGCYGAVVNGGLDLSVICVVVWVRAVVWNLKPFSVTSVSSMSCAENRHNRFFFYWSLTILIFHHIAAFLIFEQSVKWQRLEQERVRRTFAYRKLLYYNVHSHKLSLCESQNMVTSLQKGRNWKIAFADKHTHLHTGTSAATHKHIHVKQEAARSPLCLILGHLYCSAETLEQMTADFFSVVCALCSNPLATRAADKGILCSTSSGALQLFRVICFVKEASRNTQIMCKICK